MPVGGKKDRAEHAVQFKVPICYNNICRSVRGLKPAALMAELYSSRI